MVHMLLEKILSEHEEIKIAGNAYDGREGVDLVKKLSPDVIIMDIGMPEMDGLEAIQEIMQDKPTPIIVFSAASESIVDLGFKAIELGAVDLVEKPFSEDLTSLRKKIEDKLIKSIINFADFKVIRRIKKKEKPVYFQNDTKTSDYNAKLKSYENLKKESNEKAIKKNHIIDTKNFPVIGIAASTGGPQTLKFLLENLSCYYIYAAIIIVQHMAEGFMQGFGEWLANYTPIPVEIAKENNLIQPNHIYVAPGEFHLTFDNDGKFKYLNSPPIQGIRPSADIMFSSLGEVFKKRAIGIILTGMGSDGTFGLLKIKQNNGFVIAQDEESSFIFGMPKIAIESGAADVVMNISKIPEYLESLCTERFAIKK